MSIFIIKWALILQLEHKKCWEIMLHLNAQIEPILWPIFSMSHRSTLTVKLTSNSRLSISESPISLPHSNSPFFLRITSSSPPISFNRLHATLRVALSVCRSVGPSDRLPFMNFGLFCRDVEAVNFGVQILAALPSTKLKAANRYHTPSLLDILK